MRSEPPPARSLSFALSLRLGFIGLVFMLVQLLAVVWMYVTNPNDLDQLLVTAEANRIAEAIPRIHAADGAVAADLHDPFVRGTRRAFLIHERNGSVVARFDDGDLKIADEPPASFLVIHTQREEWDRRFLLSGTRRVSVANHPYWITVAISGAGFRPFVPIIFNEIRFHVLFPVLVLSLMFLLLNVSMVRTTLKPLKAAIAAVNAIEPAQVSTRIEAPASSREVQALVAAVNRMLERIERSVRNVRDFAGNAAHELRTPLAIMLLSIGKLPDGDVKSKLLKDARGMKRLIDQMLDMSLATALEVDGRETVPLGSVARAVVSELTPLAVTRGRSIILRDAGAPAIRGSADAIGRALRNLIENGLVHTLPGTAVTVTCGPDAAYTVCDCGPGIPEDARAKVLERFSRLDRSSSAGAGLGLAIVLAIMEAHGGAVEIGAAPGGGARLRLAFGRQQTLA